MCSLVPLVTMMFPNASTVPGWHDAQLVRVMVGEWLASAGGMPWQLPQLTWPVEVHTGCDVPWQYDVAQVWAARFQPSDAFTTGSGESMWPGESIVAGTA